MTDDAAGGPDVRAELRRAVAAPASPGGGKGVTSDLSIDEALLLHAIGWEPVDLVCGVSVASVPGGVWSWGAGEIAVASEAQGMAFEGAVRRISEECGRVGAHGVVGVHVEATVHRHHIDVELVGTAVRPVGGPKAGHTFVSDLSGRDFSLLRQAGWTPVGLAHGASFVYAPRRSAGTSIRQTGANVELTNYTQAMYAAREAAMERMQQTAIVMHGAGIVEVKVTEGPMPFAGHAIGFSAWGTTVRLDGEGHRYVRPRMVLPLDDAVVTFEAQSLRG
ncbi:MAG TPA: heavy metal-binding domain-containing protein [Acidimicrobiales bacterium]|nr:heavy metal-binding domain-containing protein [Acidimicrobiales bacterium]